mmetsp:Transcript_28560/g.52145  ORF Transcript_28560/g.52145 Transcript_28560/m.52145 type:complete len:638 (-) Transcript_28560:200-2113(-)|eukprot:CAMPEP_0198295926 /NCGR_PEP_ID=MMETSP1449-20131203/30199_1 /TAXON_ID=420275 /ORGANISM="Attheya septentrionalis, Strain CCMP2084" /LENGTH=637 /DNA_ID=CAMNT_0043996365 /DNA_START=131 /DNA_END=2044 /DNA_ORIENTATION=+
MSSRDEDLSSQWRSILDDPSSSKAMRDIALSQLNDSIGIGKAFTGEPDLTKPKLYQRENNMEATGWDLVEALEMGYMGQRFSANDVISIASSDILSREDNTKGPIRLRYVQKHGKMDVLSAYPKLHKAAKQIINDNNADNEVKSNAYVVLSYLHAQSIEGIRGKAMDGIKKAIRLNPSDWRLHSVLATRNMAIGNTSLCLDSLFRAGELTTDEFATFSLGIQRGKTLMRLNREDEAIAAFDEVISLYKNGLKDDPKMSDRLIGHLAVAEYMLVQCYGSRGERRKAVHHFEDAEEKRNSIDKEIAKAIDWGNRMVAEVIIADLKPGMISHGECDYCGKVTDSPKRCAACKAVCYCSKDCQVTAWKNGHKKQCKKLKSDQDEKKSANKNEFQTRQSRTNLPPLDINLDPKQLWKEGVQLSKSGFYEDSAWKFLLALFLDAALDANDKTPVKKAVEGCKGGNPVAMALSVITHRHPFKRAEEMFKQASLDDTLVNNVEMGETVDDVDRKSFGLGMCHLMYARMLGRGFAVKSAADAKSKTTRNAFEDIAKLVMVSTEYMDSQRWLTLQFELGYSSMDAGAINEAEKWLGKFKATIDNTKEQSRNQGAAQHWSAMRSRAESRLQMLPLMKMMGQNNPGFLM